MYDDRNYSYDTIADQEEQRRILSLKYRSKRLDQDIKPVNCECRVPRLNTLVFDKDVCLMCTGEIKS